ncbi:uncharacterized protein K452DRAFT_137304 [Aplosporella prunicola CBS 121167]|uniref:Uncharacterized protein n=1 Tax=Aplosporella prunicola CBS 121167 TaxID=1176127 RepID=A0A6A6BRR5_9PEZI|nr:uncharacterized protein K452DRAFT_137304 [Aplosporella prunicola CBS 121167]KAF2145271.1 hypothetical protein K452DRAFT_137304 [Aplosporella prunicola CBS 121167]
MPMPTPTPMLYAQPISILSSSGSSPLRPLIDTGVSGRAARRPHGMGNANLTLAHMAHAMVTQATFHRAFSVYNIRTRAP